MRVLFLSFFIVIADQVTKLLVKGFSIPFLHLNFEGMHYGHSIDIIGTILKITYVENPGMAFGIEVGSSKIFLSLFSLFASIAILVYIYKVRKQNMVFRIALALIFAGAVGNLIDRTFYGVFYGYAPIFFGKVVDFIHVNAFGFTLFGRTYSSFPIFNLADSSVTIGVIVLIFFNYIYNKKNKEDSEPDVDDFAPSVESGSPNDNNNDEIQSVVSQTIDNKIVSNNSQTTSVKDDKDNYRKETDD